MYMITILQVQAFRATGDPSTWTAQPWTMVAYLDKLQQPNGLFFHGTDVPLLLGSRQWLGGGRHGRTAQLSARRTTPSGPGSWRAIRR